MNTPAHSRAAVFHTAGEPLTIEQFPIPALKGAEALVRIRRATICGSDLHTCFGRRHSPAPSVLGHEMVGEVAAAGADGVRDYRRAALRPGDRVTWSMVWSCGECYYCRRDLRPKCERLRKFGHEQLSPGRELFGGMAEYCHLPEATAIFRVPEGVPDEAAAPANCATATAAAVIREAGAIAGETVVIHGAGMLGLTACAMAAAAGARHVVAIEPDARRRSMAQRFGASTTLNSALAAVEILQCVKDLSEGRGAGVALELSGDPGAIDLGMSLLRIGGRFVWAGSVFPSRPVSVNAEQVVRRMLRITGVHNYAPEDLERGLNFLSDTAGVYRFDELVSARFPLAEVNEAIAFAERERPLRVALIP